MSDVNLNFEWYLNESSELTVDLIQDRKEVPLATFNFDNQTIIDGLKEDLMDPEFDEQELMQWVDFLASQQRLSSALVEILRNRSQ